MSLCPPLRSTLTYSQLAATNAASSAAAATATPPGPPPNMIVAGFGMTSSNVRGPAAAPAVASSSSLKRSTSSSAVALGHQPAPATTTGSPTAAGQPALSGATPLDQPPPTEAPSDAVAAVEATPAAALVNGSTASAQPASTLPVARAPGPEVDLHAPPLLADGTTEVWDVDMHTLDASGQPWRRPGSDLSRWFNYGFDEVTWARYVMFRKGMVQGREAMVSFGDVRARARDSIKGRSGCSPSSAHLALLLCSAADGSSTRHPPTPARRRTDAQYSAAT